MSDMLYIHIQYIQSLSQAVILHAQFVSNADGIIVLKEMNLKVSKEFSIVFFYAT